MIGGVKRRPCRHQLGSDGFVHIVCGAIVLMLRNTETEPRIEVLSHWRSEEERHKWVGSQCHFVMSV